MGERERDKERQRNRDGGGKDGVLRGWRKMEEKCRDRREEENES